ncbi:hypothetical protein [Aeromicrobium sp.]|uniref:hypothetical protein n=1 Tax=Aeromicrobium sp. TaxID=1871063 RepID=UPI0030BAA7BE
MGTTPKAVDSNSGIFLTLKNGATAAVEMDGNLKDARITGEDKDDLTFGEVKAGLTKDAFLTLKAIQSTATGSLWRLLWDNPGAELAVVYGPHGNAVASEDAPHFIGIVKADGRPEIGTEVDRQKKRGEFDYVMQFIDGPEIDTGV